MEDQAPRQLASTGAAAASHQLAAAACSSECLSGLVTAQSVRDYVRGRPEVSALLGAAEDPQEDLRRDVVEELTEGVPHPPPFPPSLSLLSPPLSPSLPVLTLEPLEFLDPHCPSPADVYQ